MSKHTDINKLTIIGRLGRDSELAYTSGGFPVAKFSIASSSYGKEESWTNWFDCNFWGKRAESVNQYLLKGTQICIEGSIKQERWEKDGKNNSAVKIQVENVQLLSSLNREQQGGQNKYASEQNSYAEKQSAPVQQNFKDDIPF